MCQWNPPRILLVLLTQSRGGIQMTTFRTLPFLLASLQILAAESGWSGNDPFAGSSASAFPVDSLTVQTGQRDSYVGEGGANPLADQSGPSYDSAAKDWGVASQGCTVVCQRYAKGVSATVEQVRVNSIELSKAFKAGAANCPLISATASSADSIAQEIRKSEQSSKKFAQSVPAARQAATQIAMLQQIPSLPALPAGGGERAEEKMAEAVDQLLALVPQATQDASGAPGPLAAKCLAATNDLKAPAVQLKQATQKLKGLISDVTENTPVCAEQWGIGRNTELTGKSSGAGGDSLQGQGSFAASGALACMASGYSTARASKVTDAIQGMDNVKTANQKSTDDLKSQQKSNVAQSDAKDDPTGTRYKRSAYETKGDPYGENSGPGKYGTNNEKKGTVAVSDSVRDTLQKKYPEGFENKLTQDYNRKGQPVGAPYYRPKSDFAWEAVTQSEEGARAVQTRYITDRVPSTYRGQSLPPTVDEFHPSMTDAQAQNLINGHVVAMHPAQAKSGYLVTR